MRSVASSKHGAAEFNKQDPLSGSLLMTTLQASNINKFKLILNLTCVCVTQSKCARVRAQDRYV